jgi:hypothetical protein
VRSAEWPRGRAACLRKRWLGCVPPTPNCVGQLGMRRHGGGACDLAGRRRGSVEVSASSVARGLLAALEHDTAAQRAEMTAVETALARALETGRETRTQLGEERRLRERTQARLRAQATLQVRVPHRSECTPLYTV